MSTVDTFKLTRLQRARLFDGEAPGITGEGDCPVSEGHIYRLSTKLKIRVTRIETANSISGGKATKTWRIHYVVEDKRDPVRLIRRTPTISSGDFDRMRRDQDDYGYPSIVPEGEAAELSSYTNGGASAITDAGEAPPRGWVEEHSKQCRLRDLKSVEDPKRDANRFKDAAGRARARGIDMSDELAAIRQGIDGILKKLDDEAAA